MGLSTNLEKYQFASWFDLFAIVFYGYVSVTLSVTGNNLTRPVLFLNISIFVVFVLALDELLNRKKSDYFVESWATPIKYLVFIPSFVLYIFFAGDLEYSEVVNKFSTFFVCLHFWALVKDSESTNDRWLRVQSTFRKFAREKKIVYIKPIEGKNSETSIGLSDFVACTTKGEAYQRFDYFRTSINEVDFKDTAFLFQNKLLLKKSKISYEVPSQQSYQFLDNTKNLHLEYGMDQLRMNTLTYVFLSSFLSDLNHRNIGDATRLSKYFNNRRTHSYEYKLDEESKISSSHRWTKFELGLVATKILDSFFSKSKNRHSRRIEQLMENNLMLIAEDSPHYVPLINTFIVMVSNFSKSEKEYQEQELWTGALDAFSDAVQIFTETIFDNLEDCSDINYTMYQKQVLRDDLETRVIDNLNYSENVTEYFISIHDVLVQKLANAKGTGKFENLCFDKLIQNMVTLLSRTSYKQHQVGENKYSLRQLIELRTGIVLGTTIALRVLINYME